MQIAEWKTEDGGQFKFTIADCQLPIYYKEKEKDAGAGRGQRTEQRMQNRECRLQNGRQMTEDPLPVSLKPKRWGLRRERKIMTFKDNDQLKTNTGKAAGERED